MAFDLNKKEESVVSKTTFDLSKNDGAASPARSGKTLRWIGGLVGALVIAGGIWYFVSNRHADVGAGNQSAVVSSNEAKDTSAAAAIIGSAKNTDAVTPVVDTTVGATVATGHSTNADANSASANSSSSATTTSILPTGKNIPVTFGKASAVPAGIDHTVVKMILDFLQKNPTASVAVNGYASSEGAAAINRSLSQWRAEAVKRLLVSKGIAAKRINATGKGTSDPIATNDTEEGRSKNRRVEVGYE